MNAGILLGVGGIIFSFVKTWLQSRSWQITVEDSLFKIQKNLKKSYCQVNIQPVKYENFCCYLI